MRLLHFTQTLRGGPSSYFEEIAASQIAEYGIENVCFVIPASQRQDVPGIPDECIRQLEDSERTPLSLYLMWRALNCQMREFQPTLVHLHSSFAGAIFRAPLFFCRRRFSVVYCAHGWAFARENSKLDKLYATIEVVLSAVTDKIINISEFEYQRAVAAGLPSEKMVVIRNGIRQTVIPSIQQPLIDPAKINLLFVGRHDQQKGLDILLAAMKKLRRKDIHLHVLGASVISGANHEILGENVTYHGWKDRSVVFAYIAATQALVVPSRWEGFGLVALEAMRSGKAVLASDRGALPEIVAHGETGLLFHLNIDEICSLLESLERQNLVDMGLKGKSRFERLFLADRMNAEILALYNNIRSL